MPERQDRALFGERFDRALLMAAQVHREQVRKGSNIPYIGHMLGVCSLIIEEGGSEDEAIAGLLHDAVEDQGDERMLEEIRREFGENVASIVLACSDTTLEPKPPWRERKEAYLEHLPHEPDSVLLVSLADKLFNARAILRDYRKVGDELWTRFRAGRDDQLWYYRALSDIFVHALPGPLIHRIRGDCRRAQTRCCSEVDRRQIQINPWPSQTAWLRGWPPSVVLEETGQHPGTRTHGLGDSCRLRFK